MIGIFDSGSGGLTVLKAIREEMPSADIVYFGDIKNAPYGSRPREELGALTMAAIERLQREGATSIVSACNSVSASLAISLFDTLPFPPAHLIEMVGPTVSYFKHSTLRLLLVATPATIGSEIYQNAFHMIGKEVTTLAIADLAGAIEKGASDGEIEAIIREAMAGVPLGQHDALILACTHYPLAAHIFERVVGGTPAIFDPALAVGERVKKRLWPQEVGEGRLRFLISQDSEAFRARVAELFPESAATIEVIE